MKNLVILVLALAFIAVIACTSRRSDGSIATIPPKDSYLRNNPRVDVIDSCEYVLWGHGLAHKGNCKFCKERRKKEFYEMVDVLFNTEEQWTRED